MAARRDRRPMLSNAFAAGSNGPGTTTSTHARCQEGALRRGHATDSGRHHVIASSPRRTGDGQASRAPASSRSGSPTARRSDRATRPGPPRASAQAATRRHRPPGNQPNIGRRPSVYANIWQYPEKPFDFCNSIGGSADTVRKTPTRRRAPERKKSTGKRIPFSGSRLRKQKDPDQQTCCKCPEAQCAS